MKKYICLCLAILFWVYSIAQEKNMDLARQIQLTAYLPVTENMSIKESRYLEDRIKQLISRGGMVDAPGERFVLTANIIEHSNTLTPGSVVNMYICELDVTFYIGDAIAGNMFSSYEIETKGVGETPEQARYDALRQINYKDPMFKRFIDKGKKRILETLESGNTSVTGKYNFKWW